MFWKRQQRFEAELDAEMKDHVDRYVADLIAGGMQPDEARRQALIAFGGAERVKEACRDVRFWRGWSLFLRDFKYTIRSLRKAPMFSGIAILVLGVSIGASVAAFSFIDTLFLRLLPVDNARELSQIVSIDQAGHNTGTQADIVEVLQREPIFGGVCGFVTPLLTAEINGNAQSIGSLAMTGACLETLGVHIQIGRALTPGDNAPGAPKAAVLTDSLWHSEFNGRRDVLGKNIQVGTSLFTIVGVAEPRFTGLLVGHPAGLLIPLRQIPFSAAPPPNQPLYFWVSIFARRAPGVSPEQVQARMNVLAKGLLDESMPLGYNEAQRRDYLARKFSITSAATGVDFMLRQRFGEPLYILFGACILVLLIASVNITTLLLARGLRRRREIGIRLALGANKGSVLRLVAMESSTLVIFGSTVGLLFASWTRRILLAGAARIFGVTVDTGMDFRTMLFLGLVFLLVAAVLITAPAWQALGFRETVERWRGGRGAVGTGTASQKILLGFQVSLTLALVACGGLFASSMKHLDDMNLGISTHGVSEAMLSPLPGGYSNVPRRPYYRDLLQRVEALPNVASASLSDFTPLWTKVYLDAVTAVEDSGSRTDVRAQVMAVSDHFFDTLTIRRIAGDEFNPSDRESGAPAVIVSQALAERFGGTRLIGQHIRIGNASSELLKVVGIAGNAQLSLEHPNDTKPLIVYVDLWRQPRMQRYLTLLVKSRSGELFPADLLRRVVQGYHREFVRSYVALDEARDEALVENKLLSWLSVAFGILALALAAIGLFALLSYYVNVRTAEIGLRMALGAERFEIRRLVIRQLLPILGTGCAAGLALSLALGRVISGLIYGVSAYDPRLLGVAVATLLVTALIAAWIPAGRASSVDPLVALRHE